MAKETSSGLAAGVNAMMLPITTCTICGLSALSSEGRCKTFDASADGYGRGEAFAGMIQIHVAKDKLHESHLERNEEMSAADQSLLEGTWHKA